LLSMDVNLYRYALFHYFNHLPEKVTTQEVYWYHPLAEEHKLYTDLEGTGRLKMVS
jgi:hypothetical protein